HHADSGAADDVDGRPGVRRRRGLEKAQPNIAMDEILDLRLWNADEDDGLVMFDQLRAGDLAIESQRDDDMDRLAGIAGRVDDVGIEIDVAEKAVAGEGGRRGRLAFDGAVAIGAGKALTRRQSLEEFREPALRSGGSRHEGDEKDREKERAENE